MKMKKIFLILLFSEVLILPTLILAEEIRIENPLKITSFEALIDKIINFISWIAISLAPLMVLIAGFYFVTAGGDPKKVTTARNIILYTVIGLAIIFLAKGLIGILKGVLGVQLPGT